MVLRAACATAVLLAAGACRSHDPRKELVVAGMETYWAVDRPSGETQYLAPAVRFRVRNGGQQVLRAVQATATFRRQGETATWGSDWKQVAGAGEALDPGEETLVVLKSDGRYYSNGPVEGMFAHAEWKDATVDVFLRIGPSGWAKFASTGIERRVGARSVQALAESGPEPGAGEPVP